MFETEPTLATRSVLSGILWAPGGHLAVLHLLRREALRTMLRDNPVWIHPKDPWAGRDPTMRLPVIIPRHDRRELRFVVGRASVHVSQHMIGSTSTAAHAVSEGVMQR